MKKLAALCLIVGLLLSAGQALAVDFTAKGWWWMSFDYASGGSFMGKTRQGKSLAGSRQQAPHLAMDNFEAWQRLMFKLDAAVSENLSGTLMFEIGDQFWGQAASGGALGADGTMVEVKNAYIDWRVPDSSLKLRMGIQGIVLPSFTFENNVFIDDVAGITASYAFNDNIALTAMWMRPYNDNFPGAHGDPAGYQDNMDLFALVLPIKMDGIKVTPWVMAGMVGSNVTSLQRVQGTSQIVTNPLMVNSQAGQSWGQFTSGMLPAAFSADSSADHFGSGYATAIWGGLTGEITAADPWRIAWDANYGSLTGNQSYLNRSGWLANALIEYKLDWGIPGVYGWYSSGDDGNPHNGSERLPFVSNVNVGGDSISTFGFRASPWVNNEGILGGNVIGLWGAGVRVKDMTFFDNLKQTFRIHYFGGTNDSKMASYILGRSTTDSSGRPVYRRWTDFNSNYGVYLTQADTGLEINLDNYYKIYENLTLLVELGYIHLWLDESQSGWGRSGGAQANNLNYQDSWKVSVGVQYTF